MDVLLTVVVGVPLIGLLWWINHTPSDKRAARGSAMAAGAEDHSESLIPHHHGYDMPGDGFDADGDGFDD